MVARGRTRTNLPCHTGFEASIWRRLQQRSPAPDYGARNIWRDVADIATLRLYNLERDAGPLRSSVVDEAQNLQG